MMKAITLPILLLICTFAASADGQWFKAASRNLKNSTQSGVPELAPESDPLAPQQNELAPQQDEAVEMDSYSVTDNFDCQACDTCEPGCGRLLRHCRARLHGCWDRCARALNGCDDGCQTCDPAPACDVCEDRPRHHCFRLFHGLFHRNCQTANSGCGCGSAMSPTYEQPTEIPAEQDISPIPAVERSASKSSSWRVKFAAALGL